MKCQLFMIAITIWCVNASPTINTGDSQDPHLSAKTANIDEKNYVKRSITTKQYRLVDVPARINRLTENTNNRHSEFYIMRGKITRQEIIGDTGNSTCAPPNQRVQDIEETAINNTKKCYQPFKDIALNYPTNLKDLQISEEIHNIFKSCQPENITVILNAVDCVNATITKQKLIDPRINSLLENIKNIEMAYKNKKSCEINVLHENDKHMSEMWADIDKCLKINKAGQTGNKGETQGMHPTPVTNSTNEVNNRNISSTKNPKEQLEIKVLLLHSNDQKHEETIPVNQLTNASVKVNEICNHVNFWIMQVYSPIAKPALTEMDVITREGPVYSHCIPRSRYTNVLETAIRQSKECYQPLRDATKIYSENIGNINLSDAMKTVFQNCLPENGVIYKSSVDCVNVTMIKQGLIDPKISLLLETITNSNTLNKGYLDCVSQLSKAAWVEVLKMIMSMKNCVPVTLMWDVFNAV